MSTQCEPMAYTIREAAQMVRVSERTIRRAIASGRLTPMRIGRCVRVPRESLATLFSRTAGDKVAIEKGAHGVEPTATQDGADK